METFVRGLLVVADTLPELDEPYPQFGLDRKVDYLFAHAVLGQEEYLVSGDGGVREIERIGDVRIVSPAEFVAILEASGRGPRS